jgi:hypothetical protein
MGGASRRLCQYFHQKDVSRSELSAKRETNHAHKITKIVDFLLKLVSFTKAFDLFGTIWFVLRRFRAFAGHSCTADWT